MLLAEIHGEFAEKHIDSGPINVATLTPAQIRQMVEGVVAFQENFVTQSQEKIDKYLSLIGENRFTPHPPCWIVPPYFYTSDIGDTVYEKSLSAAHAATSVTSPGYRINPVVCFRMGSLAENSAERIASDYSDFGRCLLFAKDFREHSADVDQLHAWLDLLVRLSRERIQPFTLYGGFFSIVGHKLQLAGISHGLGYGEYRDPLSPMGGPPPDRYYIPKLHRFYEIGEADSILSRPGAEFLRCDCQICSSARHGGRGAIIELTRSERLRHFLISRHGEVRYVQDTTLAEILNDLRETIATFQRNLRALVDRIGHLENWSATVEQFV